jgi:hypothetical protein
MKCRPIDQLVFEQMFSHKGLRQNDPQNFGTLRERHLIVEVRQEVHFFYGHLDTQEAKYPGLDYTNKTHRIRLGRWPWHRRLFRAFDALGLTAAEINSLTKWEGTKWAKERFEREQGITIRDTTADCMGTWIEPEDRKPKQPLHDEWCPSGARPGSSSSLVGSNRSGASSLVNSRAPSRERQPTLPTPSQSARIAARIAARAAAATRQLESEQAAAAAAATPATVTSTLNLNMMAEESDEELESVGEALNERLRLRVALRNASGDNSMPLDEEWETWLKNAIESGRLPDVTADIVRSATANNTAASPSSAMSPASPSIPDALRADDIFPPRMLTAARSGQWHEIPDFLHDMIRNTLERDEEGEAGAGRRSESTPSLVGMSYMNPSLMRVPSDGPSTTRSRSGSTVTSTSGSGLPSVDFVRAYMRRGGGSSTVADYFERRRPYSELRMPEVGTSGPPPRRVHVQPSV